MKMMGGRTGKLGEGVNEKYDVVVIGGGHNGLVVAAYLAKAGLKICVIEGQDKVGGGTITREVTLPGFKHDLASIMQMTLQANPLIHRDELGLLSRYGLKYIFPDPQLAVVFSDGSSLIIYRDIKKTCESIAQFSRRDAEIYPHFCEVSAKLLKTANITYFSPAPPFGRLMSFLDSSEEGREYIRLILSSPLDIAKEWFESEKMQIALARFATEVMIGPLEKGTGVYTFGFLHFHRWGVAIPEGGSGAFAEALAACIKDWGGEIRLSSWAKAIKVKANEAEGVILENGEEINVTKAIICNVNVKQLFLELLKPEDLPTGFQEKVRRIKHSNFSALNQAISLKEAPKFKAGGDVNQAVFVEITPANREDFLRGFEEYIYGIPNAGMPFLGITTLADPTRAPSGKHTLYLYHYEPYQLKDGGPAKWDEIKLQVADSILETVRGHTTNMGPENILGRWIMSPIDIEKYNPAMVKGDIMHIGAFLSQYFTNRPLPGWGNYRTPIRKLYLCGASTHPGGGVTGGGRATAQVVLEDLGLDFERVISNQRAN